jgi:photosystem II stability/assembly factor-like uncharacterized protein
MLNVDILNGFGLVFTGGDELAKMRRSMLRFIIHEFLSNRIAAYIIAACLAPNFISAQSDPDQYSMSFTPTTIMSSAPTGTSMNEPQLFLPVYEASGVEITPYLEWSWPENASGFHLQLATNELFMPCCVNDSNLAESWFYMTGLEYERQYYWRVRALNSKGSSGWSEIFTFTTMNGLGAWLKQNSLIYQDLNAVYFRDTNNGMAIGHNGTILKTVNGGARWIKAPSPSQAHLTGISFADSMNGWICGVSSVLLNTRDGGNSWQIQPVSATVHLETIHFVDSLNGFAAGNYGIILKTTDGGQNWQELSTTLNNTYCGVFFITPKIGWVAGKYWNGMKYYGILMNTTDGGNNWTSESPSHTEFYTSVFFVDARRGWITGDNGVILYTEDGGAHWQQQHGNTNYALSAIYFFDPLRGWAVGSDGVSLGTIDGGVHWFAQNTTIWQSLNHLSFTDSENGWAVGVSGAIIRTRSGGQTLIPQPEYPKDKAFAVNPEVTLRWTPATLSQYYQVQVSSDDQFRNLVYENNRCLGNSCDPSSLEDEKGYYWRVRNYYDHQFSLWSGIRCFETGGAWLVKPTNTRQNLKSVHFYDEQTGLAAGDSGLILKTVTGGDTWNKCFNPASPTALADVFVLKNGQAWAVGDSGVILRSFDFGSHWSVVSAETNADLQAIFFSAPDSGWIVGAVNTGMDSIRRASLLYTANGGDHWLPCNMDEYPALHDVFFSNAAKGILVGEDGLILRTTDGGVTWTRQDGPSDQTLNSVHFVNKDTGYAAGQNGSILRTADGGIHWQQLNPSTGDNIFALFALPGDNILTAAHQLAISQDEGQTWSTKYDRAPLNFRSIFFIDQQQGWVIGDAGLILKTNCSGIPLAARPLENDNTAFQFALQQNYPNPFNQTTVIPYNISRASWVSIKIYDLQGKVVVQLIDEYKPPGNYQISINTSALASGLYFYHLQSGSHTACKKMLLVK